ncbi:hypothetical protein NX794_12440 [Streptomyces sp. LP11]|uniref:Uncharacterized protein n=1 Tax=Streptomyces pyxinicus TaxID=2970331 RepID=A0ABT2B0M8_9ACTN|nr:hypothetical protein [Streptomyces sp. LP11]MCS0602012.1 hypothetical protein [Streptomyces sp. LP11]
MRSPALTAALADIDTVFAGCVSPGESGCGRCHLPEEVAYLRTPDVSVPVDVVEMFMREVSDHFDDNAAAMRRLLPPAARALADGAFDRLGWEAQGLHQVDWRSWPAEQASAVENFVFAWWQETLATPEPPYPVADVFETCTGILSTMTPLLDRWPSAPVADAHLVSCADSWLYDLQCDDWPFSWWHADQDAGVAELQAWFARHAAPRLRARGEHDLAKRAELVGLPDPLRWDDPYWASA